MSNKIVLVSDDEDFFEYIVQRLKLRKSDEIFRFSYQNLIKNFHHISTSLIILNSENKNNNPLEILDLINSSPCIIFALNENEKIRNDYLKKGALDFFTPFDSDENIQIKINKALKYSAILDQNLYYRKFLEKNGIISQNNEVYLDYKSILEKELNKINENSIPTTILAISPDEKTKYLLQSNQIETCILNNIRKNDILINYAPNKYFLLLYNTNLENAKKVWEKIKNQIPEKIYAGFANALYKKREILVNEILNQLHIAINNNKNTSNQQNQSNISPYTNFKSFKQDFEKKIDNIIVPVFYQIQQKYNEKLWGTKLFQETKQNNYKFTLENRNIVANLTINFPGFSKINIDIEFNYQNNKYDKKRISLDPEEFESGILEDILEQFILDFKKETEHDNT